MRYYTVKEAAERLGVSERYVYNAIHRPEGRGRLNAIVRRGYSKGFRISEEEVERWFREEWEVVA